MYNSAELSEQVKQTQKNQTKVFVGWNSGHTLTVCEVHECVFSAYKIGLEHILLMYRGIAVAPE